MPHSTHKKFIYFIIALSLFLWPVFSVQSSTINSSNTTIPTSNNNLTRGLVGWWTFDGKDVNATTVFDKSGQGKNGTKTAITPVAGKIGQAGKLNGTSSQVSVPDLSTLASNTGGTISFWMNSNISHYGNLVTFSDSKPKIYVYNSNTMYVYWAGSTGMPDSGEFSNGVAWTFPKAWKHIIFTWDASSYRLYVDSVLKDSDSSCSFSAMTNGTEMIGGPTPNFFNGSLDDFRVYNRSLSVSEVKQLYALGGAKQATSLQNAPTANNNIKSGLVGWWTFDGKDVNATTVFDKSGQGNNIGRYNGVALGTGKIGQAEKFDGVNDRNYVLDGSTNGSLDGSGTGAKMSWSFWMKEESGGVDYRPILTKFSNVSPCPGYAIEVYGNGILYIQLDSGSGKNIFTDMNNYIGKWTHIVLVSDGTQTCGYRNGVAGGTCQSYTSISNNDGVFFIGNDGNGGDWWKGGLDDVRIYNRALSLNEIKQLYALGKSKIAPAAPVAVGDSYQGGIVAYILVEGDTGYDANTQHGLIAMASDQSVGTAWSNVVDQLAGTSDAIGTGQANTTAIVGQSGHTAGAAKLCDDLISGGYSDWYLPSKNELSKLFLNRVAIGGFSGTGWYWSSSESNAYQSWDQYFGSDIQYADDKGYAGGYVRAVRSF